ncbi:MAG TPA: ATP synthase subunit I [Syntrophorhabdaceae bacterium]|jgi:hypothetical protein|nr:ATP synthase subunit I [Syntrophorhabdaceae bacterium]HNS14578.1 ATP synthase subunit I [Syntrophorhabdaceae bacterium]HNT67766.1 ATP synthase subunit I [Syntrophorhabdaceae bacterium]
MKETNINDIERINVFILILGSILILLITREFKYFFSFAVASSIMTLNFRFLKRIIEGGFTQSKVHKKDLLIKLPLKFLVLIGLVVLVLVFGDINVICFLIGLSTVFMSVVVNQIQIALTPVAKRRQN